MNNKIYFLEGEINMREVANTKSIILKVALELFSQRGYSSVSIRDICSEVGIKESSVYYHFKNKQEIFDDLCNYFTDVANNISGDFNIKMEEVTNVTEEEFLSVCLSYMNDYLMDDTVNKCLRMLIIEQTTNPKAAELYHNILFDRAIEGQKMIFEWLIQIGFLRAANVESMVMVYYAPIIYLFHRYLVSDVITEETKKEVNQSVIRHVKYFLSVYR